MNTASIAHEAAQANLDRFGWVFPVQGSTASTPDYFKVPATPKGFKDARRDLRDFTNPGYGVGLPTGSAIGAWVLDIDRDKDGEASLAKLESEHGTLKTLTSITGGGGRHLFFKHVEGVRNRANVRPGIDVRGEGGYVVAAGSPHASGRMYQWADPAEPIADAPQWLLDLVLAPKAPSSSAPSATKSARAPTGPREPVKNPRAYGRAALDRACSDVRSAPNGQRNQTLNEVAFGMRECIAAGYTRRQSVEDELQAAGEQAGLSADETRKTIASALKDVVEGSARPVAEVATSGSMLDVAALAREAKSDAEGFALLEDQAFLEGLDAASAVQLAAVKNVLAELGVGKRVVDQTILGFRAMRAEADGAIERPESERWRDELAWTDAERPRVAVSDANAQIFVEGLLGERLFFDELTYAAHWSAQPPWGTGSIPRPLSDADAAEMVRHLQRAEGVRYSSRHFQDALEVIAQHRRIDPIKDYLRSLKWDGQPRLDSFLGDAFGAEDHRDMTNAERVYVRAVGRRWLISAVARVISPGCQADHVLVLAGPQGVGKSSGLSALVPDQKWFSSQAYTHDKDSVILVGKTWIWEWSDLAGVGKAELEELKAFVTRRVDQIRMPYGRRIVERPRRCVLAASTNEDAFLRDPTGNRRFWVVAVGGEPVRVDLIAEQRDQLWAEAVAAYDAGERWHFDPIVDAEILAVAQEKQREREEHDDWTSELREWADEHRGVGVTTLQMLTVLGKRTQDLTKSDTMRAARVLRQLGFTERRREGRPTRGWVYYRSGLTPLTSPDLTSGRVT